MQKEKSPRNPKEASGKADQESIGEKGFDRDLKDNANESYIKKILEKDLEEISLMRLLMRTKSLPVFLTEFITGSVLMKV